MYEASVSISDTGPRAGFENIQKPCIVAIRPQKLYLVEPQCEWSFRSLGYCKSRDELVDRAACEANMQPVPCSYEAGKKVGHVCGGERIR